MNSFELRSIPQPVIRRGALGLAGALGAFLLAAAPAQASSVLVNSDLEQPGGVSIRTGITTNFVNGWTYANPTGGLDIYESSGSDGLLTVDGGHYISFGHNGGVGGSISQSFATVLGGTYNLAYLIAQQQGSDTSQVLRATITQGLNTWSVDNTTLGATFGGGGGLNFVGDGTSATLTFFDATNAGGGGGANIALDNISMTAVLPDGGGNGGVPEPATWALMLTGFGLAGASLRRRRSMRLA